MSPAEMPAGRALDALIDEKVFGYAWAPVDPARDCAGPTVTHRLYRNGAKGGHIRAERHANGSVRNLGGNEYSTDIRYAWRVVEQMRVVAPPRFKNLSLVAYCYHRTYATFDATAFADYSPETWAEANGEHATPLAICRAALIALAPFDTLSAVREAETECHAEERADAGDSA